MEEKNGNIVVVEMVVDGRVGNKVWATKWDL
jgi:hypothetical protein